MSGGPPEEREDVQSRPPVPPGGERGRRGGRSRRAAAPLPPPPYREEPDARPESWPAPPAPDEERPAAAAPPPPYLETPPSADRRDVPPPPYREPTPATPAGEVRRPLPPPPPPRRGRVRPEREMPLLETTSLPPVPPPRPEPRPSPWQQSPDETQMMTTLPPVPGTLRETPEDLERIEGEPGTGRGILRAAGTMAVATLVSRVTGLIRTAVLAAALGIGLVNSAYTTTNTLPNIVYELLIGGVLTSVIVPLLVHAQEHDRDGGVGYAQRLSTVVIAGLALVTVLAVLAAPLLNAAYGINGDPAWVHLGNWLARLLLIEIVFYGIGALATAILNSRDVFGPPAWAPVLNNVVVIATGALFIAGSGAGPLTPATISDWQVWLLGAGTTLGIVVQALVLLPLLAKAGVPLRPRWGLKNTGLREAGTLGLWVVGYVAISQVGVLVATRIANSAAKLGGLGPDAFSYASLLFQMPYGIIGVALLTALLPRMSRAAARGDVPGVARDLSLGTRLSALGLLPVTAALTVLGPEVATVLFDHGNTTQADAEAIGAAVAVGAFGLLPMAVTLLQLRVFYAMKDAKTPTLIQVGMVAVRVPLMLAVPAVVGPRHVVAGLMLATSVTFVAGWVIGDLLLHRRLGSLRTAETLASVLRMAVISAVAAVLGELVVRISDHVLGTSVAGSLGTLVVGTVVIGAAAVGGLLLARVPELQEPLAAVKSRLGRA